MRKKLLSIILSLAMVLTMVPMMGTVAFAASPDPATSFVINTSDGDYLQFKVDETGQITDNNDQPAAPPDGVSWDNTEKAIVLTNFTGKRIATHDTGSELRIKLVGNSTLTGYYEGEFCGIYAEMAGIRFLSSSTGTLNLDIISNDAWPRAMMISNYDYSTNLINIDGGTINIKVKTDCNFANGIYCGQVFVNNDANVSIDISSTSEDVDRIFGIYGNPYINTSGNVIVRSSQIALSDNFYISGNGNYYFYGGMKVSRDDLNFIEGKTREDYTVYGEDGHSALAVLGNASVLIQTTDTDIPLTAPVSDAEPQKYFETEEYAGCVDWKPSAIQFAAHTEYQATVTLVPMPGYRLGSYGSNAFEGKVPGASSTSYSNGVITAAYPETEDSSLEIVNTEFSINGPTAGQALPSKIENADCTGTIEWQCSEREAKEDTVYTAKVTLSLKDGVEKRFSGVEANGYKVNGITSENGANSNSFQITFPATGKAELDVTISGIDCNSKTDFNSKFNGKVSYDAAKNALVLDGYDGTLIYQHHSDCPLNIIVKGENTITCDSVAGEKAGIYTAGGDIYITGENDSKLRIVSDNNSTASVRGLYATYSKGRFFLDNVELEININQSPDTKCNVMTGVYGAIFLYNGAKVTSDINANCYSWYSPFESAVNIEDDSSWKPLETSINPAASRYGNIFFKDTALKNKYVVKEIADPASKVVVLKDVSKWETQLENSVCVLDSEGVCPAFENLEGLVEGEDYTVSYENNNALGTASATITGKGEFTGSLTKEFRIVKSLSLKDYSISISPTSTTYSGKLKKPAVTVKGLKSGEDYTVTYSSNTSVGKAKAVITGNGAITGSVTKYFTINPATAAIKSLTSGSRKMTVKMTTKPSGKGASAYQIYYKQKGTSTWKKTTTTSYYKTIKSLKKGKYYYVKVRAYKKVGTTTYYGAWSKTKLSKKIK